MRSASEGKPSALLPAGTYAGLLDRQGPKLTIWREYASRRVLKNARIPAKVASSDLRPADSRLHILALRG
jgi:hypothetical protein